VLARKAKEREVAAFKASLPRGHPIFTELEKVGSYNASSVLWSALKRRYDNTLSVLPEYSRKAPFAYLGSVLEPRVGLMEGHVLTFRFYVSRSLPCVWSSVSVVALGGCQG
jgi:hypothetical protein